MSLKTFHLVFIAASTLLSLSVAAWGLASWQARGDATALVLALLAIPSAAGLVAYGAWFRRKLVRLGAFLAMAVLAADAAAACPVCFGDPSSPLTKGAEAGVLFLFAVVAAVLGTIATTAIRWWRRAVALEAAASRPGVSPVAPAVTAPAPPLLHEVPVAAVGLLRQ